MFCLLGLLAQGGQTTRCNVTVSAKMRARAPFSQETFNRKIVINYEGESCVKYFGRVFLARRVGVHFFAQTTTFSAS